ncbi:MAG: hypothetical protein IIW44_02235 [Alistipes sp.]|nr:hypothetical protein [Alistipes sp.]
MLKLYEVEYGVIIKAQSNGRRNNVSVSRFNTEGNTSGNNSRDSETPALDQRSATDRGVTTARGGNTKEKEEIISAATDLAARYCNILT